LGDKIEALRWARIAAAYDIEDPRSTYNIACLFSVLGEYETALDLLKKTLVQGVPETKHEWIRYHDSDWAKIRNERRFQTLFRPD
jgi:adenylate cyclase